MSIRIETIREEMKLLVAHQSQSSKTVFQNLPFNAAEILGEIWENDRTRLQSHFNKRLLFKVKI